MTTLATLLDELESRGRLPAGARARIAAHLEEREEDSPWYLQALIGAGAWVATLCFLIAVGLLIDWGDESWPQWLVAGAILFGLGLGLRKAFAGLFVAQLSLGLCLAGWGAACALGGTIGDSLGGAAAGGLAAGLASYRLHPDSAYRFLVSLGAAALLTAWWAFHFENLPILGRNAPVAVWAGVAGWLLLRAGAARFWLPMAHGLTLVALTSVPLLGLDWRARGLAVPWWPSVVVLGLALGVLVSLLLAPAEDRVRRDVRGLVLAAVLVLGFACLFVGPGLLLALGFLLLGHGTARRAIEVLGLLALPAYLFLAYRDLHVTLMTQSLALMGTGAALLGLRRWLGSRPWAKEAA